MFIKKSLSIGLFFIILVNFAGIFSVTPVRSQATDNSWGTPNNLSHSGGANNPIGFIDNEGIAHIFWEDAFIHDLVYTRFQGQTWSPPKSVDFPFGTYLPKFVSGAEGFIHAFWLDGANRLLYSRVKSEHFNIAENWEPPVTLNESVLAIDVTGDTQGVIHLVFIRALQIGDSQAGVYYTRSSDSGGNWSSPIPIFISPYFRGLAEQDANIGIASGSSGSTSQVTIVWDNRPRKQVLLASSSDGGLKWNNPVEIDRPNATSETATPYDIKMIENGQNILLIWQKGEPGVACTQNFRLSKDGGTTWSENQIFLEDLKSCAQNSQLIAVDGKQAILLIDVQDQPYLVAWDGNHWSDPQPQAGLVNFTDPETNEAVNFRCLRAFYMKDQKRLLVVGCDNGRGKDIWSISRTIETVDEWFPPSPTWTMPALVTSVKSRILSPVLIEDNEGRFHMFWSQPDENQALSSLSDSVLGASIYYAQWAENRTTRPVAVLKSPEGIADRPSAVVDSQGRLLVVWNGGKSGEIFFSWANAARASSPGEWSQPLQLPFSGGMGSSPNIHVDGKGVIYVAYAVPYNEGRGIYLTYSSDAGNTWKGPVKVFDGAAARWESVDQPQLASTGDGILHVIWIRSSSSASSSNFGLYYSNSQDGGLTWSKARAIVEKSVISMHINGVSQHTIELIWQENNNGNILIWNGQSSDSGNTWSQPIVVSSFYGLSGSIDITTDRGEKIHMLQAISQPDSSILRHYVWDGRKWQTGDDVALGKNIVIRTLKAAISPEGRLAVIYLGAESSTQDGAVSDTLYYLYHLKNVDLASAAVETTQAVINTPVSTIKPTATQTPTPQPTVDISKLATPNARDGLLPINNAYSSLILGGTLVGLIILLFFGIRLFVVRLIR